MKESPLAPDRPTPAAEATILDGLGRRIRQLREQQGLSLRDLAERTGYSASFLSQVERGTSSASISSLATIAETLGTPLADLFAAPERSTLVVRRDERMPFRIDHTDVTYERLAASMSQRMLEPVIVTLPPRFESQEGLYHHRGEEFGLVLSGRIVLTVDQQEYELGPGDSIHFKSEVPHSSGSNPYDEPVVMLWVATPTLL